MSCTTTRRMIRSASLAEGRHENFGETGREPAKGSGHQEPAELNGSGWSPSINPNSRSGKPRRIYGDSTQPRVNERLDALSQDGASHNLSLLNEPGWALNVFWLPVSGRRACAVRSTRVSTRQSSPHPDWTGHAGTRWVTERITSPWRGRKRIRIKTEMTGTNDTTGPDRLGKKRQLLGKEEAGCRRSFCLLTAHANG